MQTHLKSNMCTSCVYELPLSYDIASPLDQLFMSTPTSLCKYVYVYTTNPKLGL